MPGALIVPDLIPGIDVDPTLISSAAAGYRGTGTSVSSSAQAVLSSWSGLAGSYSAPESAQLLSSMDPVGVDADHIASTLSSLAGLLDTLADEVAAPVRRLKELQVEAEEFVASVRGGVTVSFGDPDYPSWIETGGQAGGTIFHAPDEVIGWDEHTPSVDRNNELLEQVAAEAARLSAASAACVNGINALRDDVNLAPAVALTAEQIETAQGLPWGEAGNGNRSCSESVNDGLSAFGDGVLTGAAALIGHDTTDGSWGWDFAGQAWLGVASGLGALVMSPAMILPNLLPDKALSESQLMVRDWHRSQVEAMVGGIVGTPQQWEDDPVAAGTYAVASIGTFFIPIAGQAAGGVKVAASLARVGVAAERLAVTLGTGTHLASGFSRVGSVFQSLSTGAHFLFGTTPSGTTVRSMTDTLAYLHAIPDLVPDNLVPVRAVEADAASPVSVGGAGDAAVVNRAGGDGSSTGGGGGGGTTVLERPDGGASTVDGGSPNAGPPTAPELAPRVSDGGDSSSADRPSDGPSSDGPPGDSADSDFPASQTPRPETPRPESSTSARFPPPEVNHWVEVTGADVPGPNTAFTARTDLMPDTAYVVEGRGTFYTNAARNVTHVETSYGTDSLNQDLMNPLPDTTYVVGNHTFEIDSEGRTAAVHIEHLERGEAYRSRHVQRTTALLGGEGHEGGHLLANMFGGGAERINMVAMLREINRGTGRSYASLENDWRALLSGDPPPIIDIDIQPTFAGTDLVPSSIDVQYRIDGAKQLPERFLNVR